MASDTSKTNAQLIEELESLRQLLARLERAPASATAQARSERTLLALAQAAQSVQQALTPEEVYRAIGDEIVKWGYQAAVYRLAEDGASLQVVHHTFAPDIARQAEKLIGFSVIGYSFPLTPGSMLWRDFTEKRIALGELSDIEKLVIEILPGYVPRAVIRPLLTILGIKRVVGAPLIASDKAVGYLFIMGDDLSQADIPAVTIFANQAAIAFEKARLYEQAQKEIAERKQADQALRQNVANQAGLIESTDDQMWSVDAQYRLIVGNDAFTRHTERVLGRALERGENILQKTIPAELRDEWQRYFDRALKGERFAVELPTRLAQPEHIREYRFNPIHSDGQIIGVAVSGRDITARLRAEEALRESKEHLQLLIDHAPAALAMFDQEMRYVAHSRRWLSDFHLQASNLIGKSHYEVFPELTDELKAIHQRGLKGETLKGNGTRFERADGSVQWLHWEMLPWHTADGSVGGITIFSEDITERKRAEEEKQEAEFRYRALFEQSHDGIFILDFDGVHLDVNQRAADMLGYTVEEMRGLSVRDLSAQLSASLDVIQRLLNGEHIPVYERTFRKKNGEILPVEINVELVRDARGKPLHIQSVARDISERKRAEEKLRASHARLKKVLEVETVGVMFWDLTTGCMTDANDTFLNMMGYSRREVEARELTWQKLTPPEYVEASLAEIKKFQETGRVGPYEKEYLRKDGTRQWMIFAGSSLGGDACVEFCVDIADRKRAEEKLRESEEKLRMFIEHAPAALAMFDREMRYLAVSRRWLTSFHLGDRNILGKSHYEVFPEIPERWKQMHRRALAGEVLRADEDQFVRKNGAVQWESWEVRPWFTTEHTIGGIVIFSEDITARKQAEEDLRETREIFQIMFNSSPIATTLSRLADRVIMDVNAATENLFGYTRAELIGKPSTVFDYWVDPQARQRAYDLVLREGKLRDYEFSFKTKSGALGQAILYIEVLERRGKKYFLSTFIDITARKQAESALVESEKRYRTLFENVPVGLGVADFAGKVLDYNQAMLNIHGFTPENAGEMESVFQSYADPATRTELLNIVRTQGYADRFATKMRRKDGTLYDALLSVRVLEIGGEPALLAMLEDITERKQREREREVLLALATALRAAHTPNEMLPIILDQTLQLMNLDGAAIAMRDAARANSVIELARGALAPWHNLSVPLGQGITGQVIANSETFVTDNLERDPQIYHPGLIGNSAHAACAPLIADQQTIGALWIHSQARLDDSAVHLLEGIASMAATAIHRATLFEQTLQYAQAITAAYEANIEGWSRALDLRDRETEGHTQRVTELTLQLARVYGIPESELVHIRRGALLHDIGKMGVPDRILLKPDQLTADEWAIMRQHPTIAHELLSPIEFLRDALDIPYCHHEKWDGTGYPRGLRAEAIPLAARLFAAADVYDALCSNRPYRPKWTKETALEYIRSIAGTYLDPKIVDLFLRVMSESADG